jgi:AsmA-like C-terminal region
MKLLRAAAILLLAIIVLLAAAALAIFHDQATIVSFVLQRIRQQTGYQIVATDARMRFGSHLRVLLDHPTIGHDGRELMRADRIRVYISYHALIWNRGLPLRGIVVVNPIVQVPVEPGALAPALLPRPDLQRIRAVAQDFRDFTGLVQRLTISNALVNDTSGKPLLEEFSLTAAPRRKHAKIWNVGFLAPQIRTSVDGLQASGRMSIDTDPAARDLISGGELWFWQGTIRQNLGEGITVAGNANGNASFGLTGVGELRGQTNFNLSQFKAEGRRLINPIRFDELSLHTSYAASNSAINLGDIRVTAGAAPLVSGDFKLSRPFQPDAEVFAHLNAMKINLADIRSELLNLRGVPPAVSGAAANTFSGRVLLEGATYQSALKDAAFTAASIGHALWIAARLDRVGVRFSGRTPIPPISDVNLEMSYAKSRITLAQGSGALGRSAFKDFASSAEYVSERRIRYSLTAAGILDIDELYPAAIQLSPALASRLHGHIDKLSGRAAVDVTASGNLDLRAPALPARYLARIQTGSVRIADKDLPQPIAVTGGVLSISPENIEIKRMTAAVAEAGGPGSVSVNGSLAFGADGFALRQLALELHQIRVQEWLPLVIDPQDIAARGPLGGSVTVARAPRRKSGIRAKGRLTMGAGEVQLGFLRAPIVDESATLTFDGRGLLLAIIGAKLQGSPLDFSLGVADLDNPELRIIANSGRLDLEVMKFIRVPWAPSPPAHFFPVPVLGHIHANNAQFERLAMSKVQCDFKREVNGDWNVHDFLATIYSGRARLDLSGRGRDDWINIKGRLEGVQAASLFALASPEEPAPLSGRLNADTDLWANSNTDFFNTMAGTISIDLTDGVLHKFTLLSRILSFINVESWLSAKIPDPRVRGVPFQTLTADFKGRDGDFYCDNLLLRGPVMNISALGHVHLADGNVDMRVGMVPFKTVNWLVGKVPIIGPGLSSDHFVAAYFHVTGPLKNPRVIPKPITSVAYFLTNVIKLPINILKGIGGETNGNGN